MNILHVRYRLQRVGSAAAQVAALQVIILLNAYKAHGSFYMQ